MRAQADPAELAQRRRFLLAAGAIVLFGLLVRCVYVLLAQVDVPIRGDINQYVLYAWNLVHRGVFSSALPDAAQALPDSYRGPGYPSLLALTMLLAGHSDLPLRAGGPEGPAILGYASDTWMRYALALQVALGTATVALAIRLARDCAGRGAALAAGVLTAFWPHLVVFCGVLLSETLFAFTLALALCLTSAAARDSGARWRGVAAGIAFGVAYLVNPVVGVFPALAAGLMWRHGAKRPAVLLLGVFLVMPAAWALRNATLPAGSGSAHERAAQNFVQGSIPQYLTAYNSRLDNEISAEFVALADEETRTLLADPAAGLSRIAERMRDDPAFYAQWYLLEKPQLLWDWSIRIGWGDIYFLQTRQSPYERIALLAASKQALQWINPALTVVTFAVAFWWGFAALRRASRRPLAAGLLAVFVLYVTVVHVVLQAEPRYAVPYRPEQLALVCAAIGALAAAAQQRRAAVPVAAAPAEAQRRVDVDGASA